MTTAVEDSLKQLCSDADQDTSLNLKLEGALGVATSNSDREVICGDSIEWMKTFPDCGLPRGYCGFTSLPDITELHNVFFGDVVAYKAWFVEAAALFMTKLCGGSYVIFLQSDVRVMSVEGDVSEWLDKSYLLSSAAEKTGCTLMWHKLVSQLVCI